MSFNLKTILNITVIRTLSILFLHSRIILKLTRDYQTTKLTAVP